MTPADLRALAARVETEAPSRELDIDIAYMMGFGDDIPWEEHIPHYYSACSTEAFCARYHIPFYTISIDAAAALMPEGWQVQVRQYNTRWAAHAVWWGDGPDRSVNTVLAPTEPQARAALALCCMAADLEAEQ